MGGLGGRKRLRCGAFSTVIVALAVLPIGAACGDDFEGETATCDPGRGADACSGFVLATPGCAVAVCDPEKRVCVEQRRDGDADGELPVACGGTDCDDADPKVNKAARETCDGRDNDCNGRVDDGVLLSTGKPTAIEAVPVLLSESGIGVSTDDGERVVGAYVARSPFTKGECIGHVELSPLAQRIPVDCTFQAQGDDRLVVPRQPSAAVLGGLERGAVGVAFVQRSGCAQGRLSYRYTDNVLAAGDARPEVDGPCPPANEGVALPALRFVTPGATASPGDAGADSGADAGSPPLQMAIVGWQAIHFERRDDAPADCAAGPDGGANDAPLRIAAVRSATTSPQLGALTQPYLELTRATSVRPAAILAIEGVGGAVVVAPASQDRIGIWHVDASPADGKVRVVREHFIDGIAGARGVAARVGTASVGAAGAGVAELAVLVETGCFGAQGATLALGKLRFEAGELIAYEPARIQPVARDKKLGSPGIAWLDREKIWLASWVEPGPTARAQRLAPNGDLIGDEADLLEHALVATVTPGGTIHAFDPAAVAFLSDRFSCSP